jgi:hypothetical protein
LKVLDKMSEVRSGSETSLQQVADHYGFLRVSV